MIDSGTILETLSTYQLPAILLGSILFGETVIITAAFLSAQGYWSPVIVFVLSLIGTISSDIVWFILGKYSVEWLRKWNWYKTQEEKIMQKAKYLKGSQPWLALLFIKFLYGTRIIMMVYFSIQKIPIRKILVYNIIGTTIWLIVMIAIGWLAGKSIINLTSYVNRLEYIIPVLIAVLIVYKGVTTWLTQRVQKM